MYKVLNEKELEQFINKYFKIWNTDIRKVSVIEYNYIKEYLINDAVIFIEK